MVELRRARNTFAKRKIRKIEEPSGGRFFVRNPIKGVLEGRLCAALFIYAVVYVR